MSAEHGKQESGEQAPIVSKKVPPHLRKPLGRRSDFTPEISETICTRLALGESLRSICRDEKSPGLTTVMQWLDKRPDFAIQYARARELQAEYLFDEIIEIADKATIETVQQARLQIDTRKWAAGKMAKKYADRQIIEGDKENPLHVVTTRKIDISGLSDDQLDALEAALSQTLLTIEHEPTPETEKDA